MTQLDTAGADPNGIALGGVHLLLALIDLLVEKQLITSDEIRVKVTAICNSIKTGSGVGEQRAADLLRSTFRL